MELLLLLLCASLLVAGGPAGASGAAVLDADGDALQRGRLYYAASVMRPGGGLTLTAVNGSCPLNVAQAPFTDLLGLPLAFFPENPDDATVQEGLTLNIKFSKRPPTCRGSTIWKVDGETGFVTIGGSTSTSIGPNNGRFSLRRVDDSKPDYQIGPCPCSVGVNRPSCRIGCIGALGRVSNGGSTLLGVNGDRPHTVNFVKVKSS